MRNTTKLNHLLILYDLKFSADFDETITLTITNKANDEEASFKDETYAKVLNKAYGFMKKKVKTKKQR